MTETLNYFPKLVVGSPMMYRNQLRRVKVLTLATTDQCIAYYSSRRTGRLVHARMLSRTPIPRGCPSRGLGRYDCII